MGRAQLQVGPMVTLVVPGWGTDWRSVLVHSLGAPNALPERWKCPPGVPDALSKRVALVRLGGTWQLCAPSPEPCAGDGAGGWRAAALAAQVGLALQVLARQCTRVR
jgi:hypothetical protein